MTDAPPQAGMGQLGKTDPTALWWERLPQAIGRFSPMGHLALTDGSYLRALPYGPWSPAIAFGLGLLIGFRPWEDSYATYSYSLTLTGILVVIGVLGASVGAAAWIGFCLGDFVASKPPFDYSTNGILIADLVLAVAMVFIPVVALGLRNRAEQLVATFNVQMARWAGWAAYALTAGVGAYVWELSVPQLIRPIWVFNRLSPELPAIEPLQRDVGLTTSSFEGLGFFDGLTTSSLFMTVVFFGIVRAVLTEVAERRDPLATQPVPLPPGTGLRPPVPVRQAISAATASGTAPALATITAALPERAAAPPGPLSNLAPTVAKSVGGAFITAVILAGLTTSTEPRFKSGQWMGMFAAFVIAALVRNVVLGFVPQYVRLVNKVPIVARILVCGIVSQSIASGLIEDALAANDNDFSSLLTPMLISVGLAAVLLPGRRPTELAEQGVAA